MSATKDTELQNADETQYRAAEAERVNIASQLHRMELAHNQATQPLLSRQRELCGVIENLMCNAGEW